MSVQVSYKKQIFFGIFTLLILLVVIEGIARVYEYLSPNCSFLESDAFKNVDFFLKIQICLDQNLLLYEEPAILLLRSNQHLPTININSHGFRGEEITKEKDENTYRIFVVGGSTVFGSGATSDSTTIPGYLQQFFENSNEVITNIEVINAGISNAWSLTESYYIKNILLEFDPDLFIIYDGWNDANERHMDSEIITNNKSNHLQEFFRFKDIPFYRTPFVLYDLFSNKDLKQKATDEKSFNKEQIITNWVNRWNEICEIGLQRNFSTIIIVQPHAGGGNKKLSNYEKLFINSRWSNETKEIMEGFAGSLPKLEKTCSETIDMRNILDQIEIPVYFDGVHIIDHGNRIIAQKIYELVLPLVKKQIKE